MNVAHVLAAMLPPLLVVGCAGLQPEWTDNPRPEKAPAILASPKVDAGSAMLEVAFVSIVVDPKSINPSAIHGEENELEPNVVDKPNRSEVDELWRWVDETAISPECRAELRLNGLRVGRVHTQSEFDRALNTIRRIPYDEAERLLASAAVGSDVSQASRQIPCQFGRRYELPVRQPATGEIATLVSIGGKTIGRTLEGAQPMFAVTVQPNDASGVRVRMQPEIQYGEMHQTWVSSDSALRIDNRRDSWAMDQLAFEMTAAAGGTIVAGAIMPPHGLGEQMFTGKTADGDVDHVLIVIRVAELPNMMSK